MKKLTLGVAALCSLTACSDPTELLLVVDTDLRVPLELDTVQISVDATALGGEIRTTETDLSRANSPTLPLSLGIVHSADGALSPLHVTVVGLREGTVRISRNATLSFASEEILMARLDLVRSCIGVNCGTESTCTPDGCRPRRVFRDQLAKWTGEIERIPGSTDSDSCSPVAEVCNGKDDDCDQGIDEGVSDDATGCRLCEAGCPDSATNAERVACEGGLCVLHCAADFADCDGALSNGCEANLRSQTNCGSCGSRCDSGLPGVASTSCSTGRCQLNCQSGRADCDALDSTGCEARLDSTAHCGACGASCPAGGPDVAASQCVDGACSLTCEAGAGDCDGDPDNGCETALDVDVSNCGRCGQSCTLPLRCCAGSCGLC